MVVEGVDEIVGKFDGGLVTVINERMLVLKDGVMFVRLSELLGDLMLIVM